MEWGRIFSDDEMDRRLAETRRAMTRMGLDLIVCTQMESLFYLTSFQTPGVADHFLILGHTGLPVIVTRRLEATNALLSRAECYACDDNDPASALMEVGRRLTAACATMKGQTRGEEGGEGGDGEAEREAEREKERESQSAATRESRALEPRRKADALIARTVRRFRSIPRPHRSRRASPSTTL